MTQGSTELQTDYPTRPQHNVHMGARRVAAQLAPNGTRRASAPRGEALAMAEAAPGFGTGTDRPAIGAESRASTSLGCAAAVERLRQRDAGALIAPFWSNRLRPDRAHPLVGHLGLAQFQVRSRLHVWIFRSCLTRTRCLHGRCARRHAAPASRGGGTCRGISPFSLRSCRRLRTGPGRRIRTEAQQRRQVK